MPSIINALTASGGGVAISGDATGNLALQTAGNTAVTIDTSQNVGIGTTTPNSGVGFAKVTELYGATNCSYAINAAGLYRADFAISSSGGWLGTYTATDMRFVSSNTERMRITSGGNLLVGTTSISRKFAVASSSAMKLSTSQGALFSDTTNDGGILVGSDYTYGVLQGCNASGSTAKNIAINPEGGECYVGGTGDNGAYNLQCNGTGVWGAGAYVNGSDERIKENVAPLDSGLDVVAKLNPVTYKYKESWSKDQSTQTGFIAQELLTALKDKNYVDGVVQQGGKYMSVAYQNIIPILTKAIQEQQAMIETLQAEVQALKGVA